MRPSEIFDQWVQDSYLTNGEVAERLSQLYGKKNSVSGESVRQWRCGFGKPRLRLRPVIEMATKGKVKAASWRAK